VDGWLAADDSAAVVLTPSSVHEASTNGSKGEKDAPREEMVDWVEG
jgi:hypothetical protein